MKKIFEGNSQYDKCWAGSSEMSTENLLLYLATREVIGELDKRNFVEWWEQILLEAGSRQRGKSTEHRK